MLVTLLVLWVVVVPVVTLAGTYVLSGVLGAHVRTPDEQSPGVAVEPVQMAASPRRRPPIRIRAHANRSRDHALTR